MLLRVRLHRFFTLTLTVLLMLWAASSHAAVVTWNGTGSKPALDASNNDFTVTLGGATRLGSTLVGNDPAGGVEARDNALDLSGGSVDGDVHGAESSGELRGNSVTINGTSVDGSVYAGMSTGASLADGNSLSLTNTTVQDDLAASNSKGNVSNSTVTLNNSTVGRQAVGGFSDGVGGTSTNNTLTLENGSSAKDALGGYAQGLVSGNRLEVMDSTVTNDAFGGQSFADVATNNTLVIQGSTVHGNAYGGHSFTGKVEGNSVDISGAATVMETSVYGGYGSLGVQGNTVNISAGTMKLAVAGGYGIANSSVTGNSVNISGGTFLFQIFGGWSDAETSDNTVVFGGTANAKYVIGGRTLSGVAKNNELAMTGGIAENVSGGWSATGGRTEGNIARISGGEVTLNATGGEGSTLVATNRLEISGTAQIKAAMGGYSVRSGLLVDNVVDMSGGTVGTLYGGRALADKANGNTALLSGGTVQGAAYGAWAGSGAEGNSLAFSGGTVDGILYGGYTSRTGNAIGNTLTMANAVIAQKSVYGGYAEDGAVEGNAVALRDNVQVTEAVFGGYTETGAAKGNSAGIGGTASVGQTVTGGYSKVDLASENTVLMTGGTVAGALSAGVSDAAQATSNVVKMTGGTVGAEVRGGAGLTGVSDNGVDLSGGTVRGDVFGGQNTGAGSALRNTVVLADALVAEKSVYGGHSTGGAAEENAVSLNGTASVGGAVVGGYSQDHDAKNNSVAMTGGTVATYLAGGQSATGAATGNTVGMSGGTVSGYVAGGQSLGGNATGNTVDLSGGTFATYLAGGQTDTGAATGNTVNIRGGATGEFVYGGYATGAGGSATGNTVNLYGSPELAATTIYGGRAGGDARSGNTLNVFTSNLVAKNVANFAKYNFILPDYVRPGHTVLRLTDTDPTVVGDAEVGVGKIGGGMLMQPGDRIFLLQNEGGGVQAEGMKSHNIRGQHGVAVEYLFTVRATDTTVEIYLDPATDPVRIRPEMKALSEAYVATLALINQGAELATKSAVAASRARTEDPWGLQVFGTVAGGSARYNTGSHVDLSGTNMVTGVTKALPVQNAQVLVGAFVEAGFARYQTHNGFSDRPAVGARGNNRYVGGGLLAHATQLVKDANGKMRPRGAYTEASLRAGRMDMDFASKDLRDATGRQATYDTNAPYFGAHFGTGYVWDLGESTTAEVYGQVYWTHLKGAKFSVLGDPVTVDDVNSWRLRAGARVNHAWNKRVSGYVGAAYEHGFDGKVNAKAYHLRIPSPKLQGGSGLAEAGLRITPSGDEAGFSADINVNGSVGHKQSLGGEVTLQYEF